MAELKLDPVIKKEWLAALRSGEYDQGRGYLNIDEQQFCCLGVLCEVLDLPKHESTEDTDRTTYSYEGALDTSSNTVVPYLDPEKYGNLNKVVQQDILIGDKNEPLENHNDNGISFDRIADAIEEQL